MSACVYKIHLTIKENLAEVFSCQFTTDSTVCCVTCQDGFFRGYNVRSGKEAYRFNCHGFQSARVPVTSLRFRPPTTNNNQTKNVALIACSDGLISHWHVTSGKCLNTIDEKPNEVYAVDFTKNAAYFATAGTDRTIRIYDEATKSFHTELSGGSNPKTAGHSNRIFGLKWVPGDDNLLISAGWDNTVQVWDIRTGGAVRSIFGPYVCGDALDMHKNIILTGSCREHDQLELWDFGSGNKLGGIKWPSYDDTNQNQCQVFTAKFSNSGHHIAAGGSQSPEAHVFEVKSGQPVGGLRGLEKSIYSVHFSHNDGLVAFAGADGTLYLLKQHEPAAL
eukprot:TRINITY_DN67155_c4_g4_i1.p1 TRINITY_DN67155_c4_g4~~TRINITY_DN67155_c4_g4_i1.p1  ORF type:complete len:334 (+),score=32.07 TRINITY_DN67155_c4_g4_i1:63-1064(+)